MRRYQGFASILIASAAICHGAIAQAQECTCQTTSPGGQQAIGHVVSASGQVLGSATSGFVQIGPGAELKLNSQVVVGPNSFADISVGDGCALSLSAGAEATIVPKNEEVCVRVNDSSKVVDPSASPENQAAAQSNESQNAAAGSQSAKQTAAQGLKNVGGSAKSPFAAILTPAFGATAGLGAAAVGGAVFLGAEETVGGGGTAVSQ